MDSRLELATRRGGGIGDWGLGIENWLTVTDFGGLLSTPLGQAGC